MTDLVQVKESLNYPGLFVHKYKRKVFFNNLWNRDPALVESRGRVYDKKGNVVINSFTKVFNHKENGTDINPDEECLVIEKINGFMGCSTWVPQYQEAIVSTTGSLDSDFVGYAKDKLKGAMDFISKEKELKTYSFEIVHEDDPHIIPEKVGAYLIGVRDVNDKTPYFTSLAKEQQLDKIAEEMGVMRPKYHVTTFAQVLEDIKTCKHEGFMVYGLTSGTVLKLKSPYYLALKAAARKKDIETLDKSRVDEEFYGLIDTIKSMKDDFNAMSEQERLKFMHGYFGAD